MLLNTPYTSATPPASLSDQRQWWSSRYQFHYPSVNFWQLPRPVACPLSPGPVTIFNVPADILQTSLRQGSPLLYGLGIRIAILCPLQHCS
jgi:hypothetical protein